MPTAPLARTRLLATCATMVLLAVSTAPLTRQARAQAPAPSYENMPGIAPPGVRVGKYLDVPEAAKGPAVDPAKGYRIQMLGRDLYMVTENVYQAMFLVHETGVVVVDAPPTIAAAIPKAIAEVTDKPITHLIYSHSQHRPHRRRGQPGRAAGHHRARGDQKAAGARQRSQTAVADGHVRRQLRAERRQPQARTVLPRQRP